MREIFHIAFRVNGHSNSSTDKEEIRQAYLLLRDLMKNVKKITGNQPAQDFIDNEIYLGSLWNGDAAAAQKANPAIQYIYPKEGAVFWMDSFVIPSQAPNVENAHTFIDYMLRPDIAIRCVNELHYATPNIAAKAYLSDEIKNNPIIFPPTDLLKKAKFLRDVGDMLVTYQLYWRKLKLKQ
jgi:spermidine/putrescine transport system substrate-binding protein